MEFGLVEEEEAGGLILSVDLLVSSVTKIRVAFSPKGYRFRLLNSGYHIFVIY